jgi:hypothetical protein
VAPWKAFYENVTGNKTPKTGPADFAQDLELFSEMMRLVRNPDIKLKPNSELKTTDFTPKACNKKAWAAFASCGAPERTSICISQRLAATKPRAESG